MGPQGRLTFIGGARVDHVLTSEGGFGGPTPGGNAFFAAAAAHLWGVRDLHVVTRLRTPWQPEWTRAVEAAGICVHSRWLAGDRGDIETFFRYDLDGNRVDVEPEAWSREAGIALPRHRLSSRAAQDPEEAHVAVTPMGDEVPEELWRSDVIGLMTAPLENQRSWLEARREAGCDGAGGQLLLDPYITSMARARDADLSALLRAVDVFLPSESELQARYPRAGVDAAVIDLRRLGAGTVVVKHGRRGADVYLDSGVVHVPHYHVEAPDPTGAGDSFAGGFACGWLETGDVVEASLYGAVSASFMVQDFGFMHVLDVDRSAAMERLEHLRARWRGERMG